MTNTRPRHPPKPQHVTAATASHTTTSRLRRVVTRFHTSSDTTHLPDHTMHSEKKRQSRARGTIRIGLFSQVPQFLLGWTPLAVLGTALVLLQLISKKLCSSGSSNIKEVLMRKPSEATQVGLKAVSTVHYVANAILETLWGTGCSVLATVAVSG